ncbi:hypothetical protein GCM10011581_45420 [Saccharopolyspora subtropica]|uniref:Uncharacterized protein n=1 Tax=Saccharopolyspora thermophila TaxID=89367 RepID=A0A917K9G6_9PSEU|nr:hypothetical protein GCM10011581_45420 [Saccharopolyspora subtropica]
MAGVLKASVPARSATPTSIVRIMLFLRWSAAIAQVFLREQILWWRRENSRCLMITHARKGKALS